MAFSDQSQARRIQDPLRYKQEIENLDSNTSHMQILSMVPDASKVLDIGCACGDLGAYLFKHKHCIIYGMEYDAGSIDVAQKTGAYAHIEQIDLNAFDIIPSSFPKKFDRIIFGDVLEHLNKPEQVLNKFIPALEKNGRMIISLPNIAHGSIAAQILVNKFTYMDYGILDRTHVRFFTSESIASMMAGLGLKILSTTRTIWNLQGLHSYTPAHMLPQSVMEFIAGNPHAYVLQYVFEAAPSEYSTQTLEQTNLQQLDTLTEVEKKRISLLQESVAPSDVEVYNTPDYRQLSFSKKSSVFSHAKPWLKQHMPHSLWNFLKEMRNIWRKMWHRITSFKKQDITSSKEQQAQSSYIRQILSIPHKIGATAEFVNIADSPPIIPSSCPKPIAFYLPQFHPFLENDMWWGRGFTEWSNVTKAVPQFVGHYQPQLPIDLGFYDLRVPEVMVRQVELAKLYGIYGFCFHYYWFSGKRLMERPLFNFLKSEELDMPFCLCWANESWSRRWDGSEDDLLIRQDLQSGDDERLIDDLLPFFSDKRYITIGDRPVFIVYRPHLWNKDRVLKLIENMRHEAIKHGLKGLYLITALSHDFFDDPRDWGFDAGVEFPPHLCGDVLQARNLQFINPDFCGSVHDMRALVDGRKYMRPSAFTTFKTVFPSWDNTARKGHNAYVFHHSSPSIYARWLSNALQYTHAHNGPDEQYVFINAWNEWAEGACLEPSRRYGYAFLQATADVLAGFQNEREKSA